ncbi:probable mitogen-activated protein kinase kinase kinase 12 at C-terminar half [Coccomyxa sp. Obi]|nr:probable mitogen-activated protein kinase kinase kinase 12 at C-terminar half [Coccomyxa sp. Obi]
MIPSQQDLREEEHRHAITEILFFASIGDVARMKALADKLNVSVSDASCCDYDKRTPLHLAAAEGQMAAAEWLLRKRCNPNPVDRFARTPLEDALIGDHKQMQSLLLSKGGKVYRKGIGLVEYSAPAEPTREQQAWGSSDSQQTYTRLMEEPGTASGGERRRSMSATVGAPSSGSSFGGGAANARRVMKRESSLYILPDLLQRRSAELGGLELEELIGRGSFGRVYKAIWRGGTVAVKVLSHEGSRTAKLNALHESLVSAHVHHPNVVTTYQIHTVQHIEPPTQGSEGEEDDDTEAVLRSFRIKTLSESPRHSMDGPQSLQFGSAMPRPSAFAADTGKAFRSMSTTSMDRWGDMNAGPVMQRALESLQTDSSMLTVNSSASVMNLASPFETTVDRALSSELSAMGFHEGTVAKLAQRMSLELATSSSGRGAPIRGAKSADAAEAAPNDESITAAAGEAAGEEVPQFRQRISLEDADATVETLLLMEYADLGTLDRRIVQGRLKGDLVPMLLCLLDISAGMSYLHSIGLLHSDLKGANVLLKSCAVTPNDPRGFICKIADFGMSRVLENNMTHVSTNTHGTVAYMSPEMLQRGAMAMPADVYSFAMIMLELWSGEIIYKGVNSHQVLFKVFSGLKPDVPPDMPGDYRALMEACWATEPAERPTFRDILPRLRTMLSAAREAATKPVPTQATLTN